MIGKARMRKGAQGLQFSRLYPNLTQKMEKKIKKKEIHSAQSAARQNNPYFEKRG